MTSFGAIGFLQPYFLIGLLALPLLWWLLRATPPSPRQVRFPGVSVLLGLDDRERAPQRTPWWLLLLRCLAAALLLGAFAEPIVNPKARLSSKGPLLILFDGGWGSASDWSARRRTALDFARQAAESDRAVAVASLSRAALDQIEFEPATRAVEILSALEPQPWPATPDAYGEAVSALGARLSQEDGAVLETIWLHDGFAHPGAEGLAARLSEFGALRLIGPETAALALAPLEIREGEMIVSALRASPGAERTVQIRAIGTASALDDADSASAAATERRLASVEVTFAEGETRAEAALDLPTMLRNVISRVELDVGLGADSVDSSHAGAVQLLDDRWRRRMVALISGETGRDNQPLLSGLHYLRASLAPHAAYREARLAQALDVAGTGEAGEELAALTSWADAIVLADIGRMDPESESAMVDWVEAGGLLIRFAGPKLAALAEEELGFGGRAPEQRPLLPTRLRRGGRSLGGALSWATPQPLRAFREHSPFFGLELSPEVAVARQVLAEPGPDLSGRVWASLADGTPLVTAKPLGAGQVVLFHVTANAEWSSLPLSGMFVEMMGRLVSVAPALASGGAALAQESRSWSPVALMDGYGRVTPAPAEAAPVEGGALAAGVAVGVAPGVYETVTESGGSASLALSVIGPDTELTPRAAAPAGAVSETLRAGGETPLKPWLLSAAINLLLLDILAALYVAGRLGAQRSGVAGVALALALGAGALSHPAPAAAQDDALQEAPAKTNERATVGSDQPIDPREQYAALETVLAYVVTSDAQVDRISAAGLLGLSAALYQRTAIEPGEPAGVDLEKDDISVFAILYWPVTSKQRDLSDAAIRKLNGFMRSGGLLVVDTRDSHQAVGGRGGPNEGHLRRLLFRLDLPRLEPVRPEHVLTRTYYILDALPGRWRGGPVWVAASRRARGSGGGDRRALFEAAANDDVSPIVIGGADWAAAWAVNDQGEYLMSLGRGGDRQREIAFRFGVNLAMYAFTGNYKSDQVHIPALLDRLGN